jgi:hypothetical protein
MNAVRKTRDHLSAKQLRAIQVQRRTLGLDEDTYRATLHQYRCDTEPPMPDVVWPALGAPCTSARHLTRTQASALITRWVIAGAPVSDAPYSGSRPTAQERVAPGAVQLPTPAQRALIARLVAEVPWRTTDGYSRWLAGSRSPTRGRAIRTYLDAEGVIDGLKNMRGKQ